MTYKQAFGSFVRILGVTAMIIAGLGALVYGFLPNEYYTPAFPFLLVFFVLATMAIYHFMLRALQKRPARFVNIFLLTTMVKLLAFMTLMLTYSLINRSDARTFIVAFFVLYIVFTIVEVVSLLDANRKVVKPVKDDESGT